MHLYPNVQRDLCTVRPILMDVQSPIPCSLHGQAYSHGRTEPDPLFSARSGLHSARSPHSGSEAFTIRTPPFKWTKIFENQTFSTRFTKGSGYGLVSRNCGILDVTISLATVKKWAFFSPTSSMHGWLSESTELSLQWVWGIHLAMLTHRKTTHSEEPSLRRNGGTSPPAAKRRAGE